MIFRRTFFVSQLGKVSKSNPPVLPKNSDIENFMDMGKGGENVTISVKNLLFHSAGKISRAPL